MASSSSLTPPKPVIGIISIGDMGIGIAKVLLSHGYTVMTVSAGRSQHTIDRIRASKIQDLPTDEALLSQIDILLSIVPPRDALATAKRIAEAAKSSAAARRTAKGPGLNDIIYIDLNAISPRTVAKIAAVLNNASNTAADSAPPKVGILGRVTRSLSIGAADANIGDHPPAPPIVIKFLDGGIIGPPPSHKKDKDSKNKDKDKQPESSSNATPTTTNENESSPSPSRSSKPWSLPSIPLSGPHESLLPPSFLTHLNMQFISPTIGTASSLKSCFASLTKGFTALSLLSYTTASTCGVLPHLQSHLDQFAPGLRARAESSLINMPPKAYRWIDEMKEIGDTFSKSGGLKCGEEVMGGIAEVYRVVSEETVLGSERVGKRKRGMTVEDLVGAVEEGIQKKRGGGAGGGAGGKAGGDEKLELAWRGSWGL